MIMYNQHLSTVKINGYDCRSLETLNLSIIILTLLSIGQTDDSLPKNDKVTTKNDIE